MSPLPAFAPSRLLLLLLVALWLAAPATASPERLARALERCDAWDWAAARTELDALLDAEPAAVEPWLALYDWAGQDAMSPRIAHEAAAAAVSSELQRRGERVPEPLRRWLERFLAGDAAGIEHAGDRFTGTAWDVYLEIRRRLLEPAYDADQIDALAQEAWRGAGSGPLAFYLADRLAHLEVEVAAEGRTDVRGLEPARRAQLRTEAFRQARQAGLPCALRYALPYPAPALATLVDARNPVPWLSTVDELAALPVDPAGPYADLALLYVTVAALREAGAVGQVSGARVDAKFSPRVAERLLVDLAERPGFTNAQLAAFGVRYHYYQYKRFDSHPQRWTQLLCLAEDLRQHLRTRPDLARIQLIAADAHNDPERTDFLVGYCYAQLGRYDQAIALYEQGLAAARARHRAPTLPANIFAELSSFYRAERHWGPAFDAFDEYARRVPSAPKGDWFLMFLRAAPGFVACAGLNFLHVFLSMTLAGVFLFSRASSNRHHFRFASALALVYAGGMGWLLAELAQPVDQAIALALGAGALVFMPLATGRSHWTFVCRPGFASPSVQRLALVALAIALMAAWTWWMVATFPFAPHPFWRFLRELPMMAPVAQALSMDSQASLLRGLVLVALAGLQEEVFYRGFTLPVIARYLTGRLHGRPGGLAFALAQLITAGLWAAAHAGMTEPQVWKFAHVFGLSLILGELFRRHGLLACIAAHALFNVGALLLPMVR